MAAAEDGAAAAALAEFHGSRAGVRGLVESGVTAVPRIFLAPSDLPTAPPEAAFTFTIPSVDLSHPSSSTVPVVRAAARSCGFFHVTNHGVPSGTVAAAVSAARAFHEQPRAARAALYSPDQPPAGSVAYSTIPIRPPGHAAAAAPLLAWVDTLRIRFGPPPAAAAQPDLGRLPAACRDALVEYQRALTGFGKEMAVLLSEAMGATAERLERAMQVEGWLMACHYYPPCPEPARVVGNPEHTDPSLFTVLAQDGVGGLQVRPDDGGWVDVPPLPGALLVNIGDVLKMVSNDEYKSAEHRVVIKSTEDARVSVALFFNPAKRDEADKFGPLPELVTAGRPARYRSFTLPEFMNSRRQFGHGKSSIDRFRIADQ